MNLHVRQILKLVVCVLLEQSRFASPRPSTGPSPRLCSTFVLSSDCQSSRGPKTMVKVSTLVSFAVLITLDQYRSVDEISSTCFSHEACLDDEVFGGLRSKLIFSILLSDPEVPMTPTLI